MRNGDTVSSYITTMLENVKLQMRTHFFSRGDPISITCLLKNFKPAYDINSTLKEAVMCRARLFARNALSSTLNSHMSVATSITPAVSVVHLIEPLRRTNHLQS